MHELFRVINEEVFRGYKSMSMSNTLRKLLIPAAAVLTLYGCKSTGGGDSSGGDSGINSKGKGSNGQQQGAPGGVCC